MLVEEISEEDGFDSVDSGFCLYDETDVEALETFLQSTDGPIKTQFRIFGSAVTIEKTAGGEIIADVESRAPIPASD